MTTVDEYVRKAEDAGKENAHVAAAYYYRNAAELATSREQLVPVLTAMSSYAIRLKKPTDQLAMYLDVQQFIASRGLQENSLDELVQQSIAKLRREAGKNAAAP